MFRRLLSLSLFVTHVAFADTALRDAQLADLATVRKEYLPKELAYTPATRAQAEAKLAELEKQAGSLTPAQWLVGLAQVGALADNAHSGVRWHDPKALPAKRLPLRLLWFPDALIVARATGDAADLAGAQVLAIEGLSPDALYEKTKSLQGGSTINRKKELMELVESLGVLQALGIAKAPDRLAFRVKLRSGEVVERTVAMIETNGVETAPELERLWSPEPMKDEKGWRAALGVDALPAYLNDANTPFRTVALPEREALYIQFRSNGDEEGFPIADFTKRVEAEIAQHKPQNLIVDLRFDVGGNLLTTLDFMRSLPTRAPHTYLLVGWYTYSAGIISAAAVKKSGGDSVTVVGDELGDRLAFWSEGDRVGLPNSKFGLRYTNGTFDLKDGCAKVQQCLDDMVKVNFVSLVPQIKAPLTSEAYFAKRDPGMEAVEQDIAHRRHQMGERAKR